MKKLTASQQFWKPKKRNFLEISILRLKGQYVEKRNLTSTEIVCLELSLGSMRNEINAKQYR